MEPNTWARLNLRRRARYHSGSAGAATRTNPPFANTHRRADLFGAINAELILLAAGLNADQPDDLDSDGELFPVDANLLKLSLAVLAAASRPSLVKLNMTPAVGTPLSAFSQIVPGDRHEAHFMVRSAGWVWRLPDLEKRDALSSSACTALPNPRRGSLSARSSTRALTSASAIHGKEGRPALRADHSSWLQAGPQSGLSPPIAKQPAASRP